MKDSRQEGLTIRSVERAIAILKCFSVDCPDLTLGQISERVLLAKSTVHRILRTLEQQNLVEQDIETGKYRLSFEVLRLSVIASEGMDLRKVALPFMKSVSLSTQQTSNLYVRRGFQRLCIEQVAGPEYVKRYSYVGALQPLHCGAAGKVLLAYMDETKLNEYFDSVELEKMTDRTVCDRTTLERDLAVIRNQGYAVTLAERDPVTAAVSAPVFDFSNKIVAALTVSGPVMMFNEENVNDYSRNVVEAARSISERLGWEEQ